MGMGSEDCATAVVDPSLMHLEQGYDPSRPKHWAVGLCLISFRAPSPWLSEAPTIVPSPPR